MKIYLCVLALLCRASVVYSQSDAAALRLFYEQDGKSVEIVGVENGKQVFLEGGERHPMVSTGGTWRLEGSITENVNFVYFSPGYSIWHRAVPDGQKEDEQPFSASVVI